jgi:biopolymer transport protein TolR
MPAVLHRGRSRRAINEINMVPFIDVMLVLLIIFMVTAPLITPSLIQLPSVGKAERAPDRVIQVLVGKDGELDLKTKDQTTRLSLEALAAAVLRVQTSSGGAPSDGSGGSGAATSVGKDAAVVISADKGTRYEHVVRVMDTLQRAGVARVGLSVQIAN